MNFNILGIGLPQLFIIFGLMLILFGPKKMIAWAFEAGRYTAKLRQMYQQTMSEFQKEIAASGVDLNEITRDLPKASDFNVLDEARKLVDAAPDSTPPASPAPTAPPTPTAPVADASPTGEAAPSTPPAEPPSTPPTASTDSKYSDWMAK